LVSGIESERVARRERVCAECGGRILKGERYIVVRLGNSAHWVRSAFHLWCRGGGSIDDTPPWDAGLEDLAADIPEVAEGLRVGAKSD